MLIHPIQWTTNGQLLTRSAQTGPPNARKRRPVFPPAGWSQYCAFAWWRMVFTSCLDNMTSYHLFRLARVLCRSVFNISRVFKGKSVHYDGFSTLIISRRALAREGDYEMMSVCVR